VRLDKLSGEFNFCPGKGKTISPTMEENYDRTGCGRLGRLADEGSRTEACVERDGVFRLSDIVGAVGCELSLEYR
jgi:hypothetical protein